MKIVIDIDEESYEHIKAYSNEEVLPIGWYAIINGTPLPEHHGRLGDLDVLEAEMINGIKAGNYEEGYEKYQHINDIDDCIECVHYADTIIEADRGE